MMKRLTNLLLILAIGSSVVAGTPMPSGGSDSSMMDCCKKALEENGSPSVAAARLCCAMNCNEPGSTSSSPGQNFSQTSLEPTALSVATAPPSTNYKLSRSRYSFTSFTNSKPAYILNLALLI
jgi:hypothetical protein